KRRHHAEGQLTALTPPRGRGKRQSTNEATLVEAIDRVLTEHRVEGLLSVTWEKQVEQTTQYVGRGRGSSSREKRVIQHTRSHITDRKSTRLNSSHGSISYAVFCLKKKKTNIIQTNDI